MTEQKTSTPPLTKTTPSHYNAEDVLIWLQKKGEELYGANFKINTEDHYVILKLIAYFLGDQEKCFRYGLMLHKGILLIGPVGSGKTALMNLMKLLAKTERKFFLKSSRDISFEFIKDGYEVIHRYSHSEHKNYCFDDLGIEKNLKYFGNECNLMAEIILSRYDLFVSKKIQTHITSNLSARELEAAYGNRVRSRLREMVNLISFDKATPDKRN